jgi:hypothetical protein
MSQPTPEPPPATAEQTPDKPTPWAAKAGGDTPWALKQGPVKSRTTARLRKTIDGLPAWEPTPPGEIHVQRGGRDG